MSRRIIFIMGSLMVLATLLWWWGLPTSPQPTLEEFAGSAPPLAVSPPSPQSYLSRTPSTTSTTILPPNVAAQFSNHDKANIGKILEAFGAPIEFYGKVIDDLGYPVEGATIHYSVADQYFGNSSKYTGTSESGGSFTIGGIKGAGIYVEVSKEGYYRVPDQSYASFGYGVPSGRQPPSKESPAIFVLRRKGKAYPLVHVSSRQINVLDNGRPLNIDLSTGQAGRGSLQLESWIGDSSQRRFDWRYRLSVPGGGLVERNEQFAYEAPIDGYQAAVEVNMPADAERWSSDLNKSYFAKLPDGKYARFSLSLYPGKRNFVVLESYVNPTPGTRNLEFDPKR